MHAADALDCNTEATAPLGFRAAYVFDVAQTDGDALPDLTRTASGDPGAHLRALEQAIRDVGVQLVETADLGGAHGMSRPGRIDILSSLGPVDRFATLAHELAHEFLHRRGERTAAKTVRETEAEAVAFIVTTAIGVTASIAAADYIGLYDGTADALRASLRRIQGAACTIIDAIHIVSDVAVDEPVGTLR